MNNNDILEKFGTDTKVSELSDRLGVSQSRVYYILKQDKIRRNSKIYKSLIEENVSDSEALAIVSALNRALIFSLADLADYIDKGGVLTDIYRIGEMRASALEAIIDGWRI